MYGYSQITDDTYYKSQENSSNQTDDFKLGILNMFNGDKYLQKKNIRCHLFVSLDELYSGVSRKISIYRNVTCRHCEKTLGNIFIACKNCDGSGVKTQIIEMNEGVFQELPEYCYNCFGIGRTPQRKCSFCFGKRIWCENKIIDVHVQEGMTDEQEIVIFGEGNKLDNSHNDDNGDVIIIINEIIHHSLRRSGDDLVAELNISIAEAITGFKRTIHLPGDRTLEFSTSSDMVVKHGDTKIIENQGMPKFENPSEKGDLIVKLYIALPHKLWLSQNEVDVLDFYLHSDLYPINLDSFLPN